MKQKRNKKTKYKHIVNIRVSTDEYIFLQDLKNKDISISNYLRISMKLTPRYMNFIKTTNNTV